MWTAAVSQVAESSPSPLPAVSPPAGERPALAPLPEKDDAINSRDHRPPAGPPPRPSPPDVSADLPVPSSSDNFFKYTPQKASATGQDEKHVDIALAQLAQPPSSAPVQAADKSPCDSSDHSESAVHPMLKQQTQASLQSSGLKSAQQSPTVPPGSAGSRAGPDGIKLKPRSGGRPKDAVWIYFHTNGYGNDERATCKHCGWHVERPKAFRMRDHVAHCPQVDPQRRAEMAALIAFKEAAAAAKQNEKAQFANSIGSNSHPARVNPNIEAISAASKRRKIESPSAHGAPIPFGRSPITSHVLDATSGKPGEEMAIRLDRLTPNGFVLIANGTTDGDGRCNSLLPGGSRPEIGVYKVTFFTNEFYQKRGIVSFYPFVEVTFEVKDPTEHHHVPLLLSPYSFSTYRGS